MRDIMLAAGMDEIAMVVGCRADRVRRLLGGAAQCVEHARFAQTGSLYSLWLARPLLVDGFVVLNCETRFHPQVLADLVAVPRDTAALAGGRQRRTGRGHNGAGRRRPHRARQPRLT